jgi:hypothetical protein
MSASATTVAAPPVIRPALATVPVAGLPVACFAPLALPPILILSAVRFFLIRHLSGSFAFTKTRWI